MEITRDIIQRRMDEKLQANTASAKGTIRDLLLQHEQTRDLLVSSRKHLEFVAESVPVDEHTGIPEIHLVIADTQSGQGTTATLHENALNQYAGRFGIPVKYFRELLQSGKSWKEKLGVSIANEHAANEDDRTLLLRLVNGQVRAVLSNAYRRMDSAPIFSAFGIKAIGQGAILWGGAHGELRSYLEVVLPKVREVVTPNNGTVYIAFGASISSSDFGQGSLDVRNFYVQGICTNGAIGTRLLNNVHLGKRLDQDNFAFSEQTYRSDTETMKLAVQDIVGEVLSEANVEKQIALIQGASDKVVANIQKTIKELPKLGLREEEAEMVNRLLMESDPEDGLSGAMTNWKLQQAISAAAAYCQRYAAAKYSSSLAKCFPDHDDLQEHTGRTAERAEERHRRCRLGGPGSNGRHAEQRGGDPGADQYP
jgi:hypothetical protein